MEKHTRHAVPNVHRKRQSRLGFTHIQNDRRLAFFLGSNVLLKQSHSLRMHDRPITNQVVRLNDSWYRHMKDEVTEAAYFREIRISDVIMIPCSATKL